MHSIRHSRRVMAYTAAVMYGAGGFAGLIESRLPGDPPVAAVPVVIALTVTGLLVAIGRRLPRAALALLGPIGVTAIAYALATSPGAGDGAVMYALPVLWMGTFFGRRGALAILACIAVGEAGTQLALPASSSYPGRWIDVMVSAVSIAAVVVWLDHRNQQLVAQLAGEARTDPLTGLLNRRGFDERAEQALAHVRRDASPIALVVFDIDHFKAINDEWGHEAGDRVLARIGELLRGSAREVDVLSRLGGEEFAALLPGCDGPGAQEFAQRIRTRLGGGAADECMPGQVRVSAGIVTGDPADTIAFMLRRADTALYAAKRSGRDRVVVFQEPLLAG